MMSAAVEVLFMAVERSGEAAGDSAVVFEKLFNEVKE